jgi:hypothetical protein
MLGTSGNPALSLARTRLASGVAPLALRARGLRRRVFRFVSERGIHYRRSHASRTGPRPPRDGPRAGDRLPDLPHGLQPRTTGPGCHLLLGGPPHLCPDERLTPLTHGPEHLLTVHRLGDHSPWQQAAHGLLRPDGYLGYVAGGSQLDGLRAYLDLWYPSRPGTPVS